MFTVVEMLCMLVHAVLSLTGIDNTAVVVSACAVAGFLLCFVIKWKNSRDLVSGKSACRLGYRCCLLSVVELFVHSEMPFLREFYPAG